MRKIAILLYFCALHAYGQRHASLIQEAEAQYQKKAYPQSVSAYKQAFKLTKREPSDYYNAACSAALATDSTLALSWLKVAVTDGYSNIRHLKTDADLIVLHNTAGWKQIVADLQRKVDIIEANYDKPLQAELLSIYDTDQQYRMKVEPVATKYGFESAQMMALWDTINRLDSINLIKVKTILDRNGWVGPDHVGGQANQALFLVIQHADISTQQQYLPMMQEAVKARKAEPSALALLEDRVALRTGRKQRYGSQIGTSPTGQSYVLPLEDPDRVDQRRAKVGLEPIARYVAQWKIKWNAAVYKRMLPQYMKWAQADNEE